MTNHPNRSKSPIRKQMRALGWHAVNIWTTDTDTHPAMVRRWHIVKGETPRDGAVEGGFDTRAEAWLTAEDQFERKQGRDRI
jgi:hypothetical protein